MFDRHLVGDVAIAVLLAFPTLALARPQPTPVPGTSAEHTVLVEQAAAAERSPVERRFSVPSATAAQPS